MVAGPERALMELEQPWTRTLEDYYPYWLARGSLQDRAGNAEESAKAYATALTVTQNPAVRRLIGEKLSKTV